MKSVPLMIAWRYLTQKSQDRSIAVMVYMSFIGIFVGAFCLALVTAIMHGFDIETQKKMQGIHAQATMHAGGNPLHFDALAKVLEKEFPEITFAPSSSTHTLLHKEFEDNYQTPPVVIMQAVDPQYEQHVTTLIEKTVRKNSLLELQENNIIIGSKLAETYDILAGDTISILYPKSTQKSQKALSFNSKDATVIDTITTGIDEYDNGIVLSPFPFFSETFPDLDVQQINIKYNMDEQRLFSRIKQRFNLDIYSWKDLYPAVVSALQLEKYVSFFVLALISLVASINIISLLFMIIADKKSDIAILRAMGARSSDIRILFLLLCVILTLSATILGISFAAFTSYCIEHYALIELPDVYYVSHLPSRMAWYIPLGVFLLSVSMSLLATLLPLSKIKSLSISQTLRFEG